MSFQPSFSDIRNQVMMKLRLDPADSVLVDYWMQQAYADVAQMTGFDWSPTFAEIGLREGAGRFDLPCDVAMIRHVMMVYPDGSYSHPVQQVRMEEVLLKQNIDDSANSLRDGVIYAVEGQFSVVFWPTAGKGQKVWIQHTMLPDELEDADAPLIAEPFGSKLLEYGALVEGAKFKKDPLMSDFELSYQMWMSRYVAWLNRRKGATSTAFEVWAGDVVIDRLEAESEHWGVRRVG